MLQVSRLFPGYHKYLVDTFLITFLALVLAELDRAQALDRGQARPDAEREENLDDDGWQAQGLARTRGLSSS